MQIASTVETSEDSASYEAFRREIDQLKEQHADKLTDEHALLQIAAGKWETLIQATNDTQTVAMLSLNRARRDN